MSTGVAATLRERMPIPIGLDDRRTVAESSPMAATTRRDVVLRPRVIFGVATALGFFSGFQAYYFEATFHEGEPSFPLLLALNLSYWYSWACLAPGVIWLGRRFPFDRKTWPLSVGVHMLGVFVATTLHVILTVASRTGILRMVGEETGTWLVKAQQMYFLNFDWEMMTYWAILGMSYALRYHYEAQDRALRASQLETRLVEAQLQSLQRQLQPHFLFNTLNTISALMHRDVDAADNMIAKLSDLLRVSLQTVGVQETSLKQELDFLGKYLEIEQTRFRDRLSVVFEVEPDMLDALVPNLVLQPLVENAIKHGINPRPTPGQVVVAARRVGTTLEMEVRDNGVGLSDARLSAFNRGVGLANTRSRLQHLYGSAHRFEFRQPPGGGLAVIIGIPLVDEPDAFEEASEASPWGAAPHLESSASLGSASFSPAPRREPS